jgi:hypothetical protein
MTEVDWGWKLREAVDRIKTAYAHIGRSSGAPILAIVYPPEQEIAVLREWHTLMASLAGSFDVRTIDALDSTMQVVDEFGVDTIVSNFDEPMPGSDPQAELGHRWVDRIAEQVHALSTRSSDGPLPLVIVERLAALYPAAGPRAVMQAIWDTEKASLDTVVVFLVPGTLLQPRVYSFLNRREEFMYRGDVL